ncbi:MAG: CusA/CzcA family heavy metal efflux RND transporter [Paramuribaculum sp.]|nr:CusA/CzcA family heavy metal efflux RND transporter [Paramuribaculum sp.]
MLNRIVSFALRNRVTVLMITGLLLIWGCVTLIKSEIDIFPDLSAPTVVIMTESGGLAPEEVEMTVTYPIETAMNGAPGVRRVRSSSSAGFSVVWVEFDWSADPDKARRIVSEKLMTVSDRLPAGVGTPTLGPESSILGEMFIVGLTSTDSPEVSMTDLRKIADRQFIPRLLALPGVSQASVIGGDVVELQIQIMPERLKTFGITIEEVRNAAASLNDNASGGVIYDFGNEYLVKARAMTGNVNDISKSVVRSDSRGIVTLQDIAEIRFGAASPRLGSASVNATPAVLITITKQPGGSTVKLTEEIENMIASLRPTLPKSVSINTDIFRQADFIDNSIGNLQVSLIEGAIFVIVVLFFFLMNLRTTLISLVAIPISVIVTIILLDLFDLTINTMSLGGIAIAIGSLVDDAIVDVENVYKRIRAERLLPADKRKSLLKVVYEASCEVRLPILNSTIIIAISFLPLFFLSGIEGRLLAPLGFSFVISLCASTITALTLTPVLCSYLLAGNDNKPDSLKEPPITRLLLKSYSTTLRKALSHKRIVIGSTIALLIVAASLFPTLGRSFLPPFNEGSLTINVSALPGISLEESDKIGREAERIILSMPEIETVARKTGRAELDEHSLGTNVSEIEAPYTLSGRTKSEMVRDLREKLATIPGVNIEIGQPISHRIDAMLSGTEAQIAIKVFGDNLTELHKTAMKVKEAASKVDGVVDLTVEQQVGRPQLEIKPKREMLASYGITNSQFLSAISTMLDGEKVSQIYENGFPVDIVVKVAEANRSGIKSLSDLMIDSNQGQIPLSAVAEIVSTDGPNLVNRENVSRRIVISANVDGKDLRGTVEKIKHSVAESVELPAGYFVEYSGQFESEANASRTLLFTSLGAIAMIFLLLMREYKNVGQSLIILVNMPLAIIGGILILVLSGNSLNIPAIIGFISLMGIATRNGMLLMSRYNSLKQSGMALEERIMAGSCDRLTPIVMTALTSALALIPLAIRGAEPGNEIQSPMALVILGGLLTSTFLNIFVVPILYNLIDHKRLS